MVRVFTMLTVTLSLLFFMTGCQTLTGATWGENIDDGTVTSYVKTKLAEDRLSTLTRDEVQTIEQRSRIGSLASQLGGVKPVVNNPQVQEN